MTKLLNQEKQKKQASAVRFPRFPRRRSFRAQPGAPHHQSQGSRFRDVILHRNPRAREFKAAPGGEDRSSGPFWPFLRVLNPLTLILGLLETPLLPGLCVAMAEASSGPTLQGGISHCYIEHLDVGICWWVCMCVCVDV